MITFFEASPTCRFAPIPYTLAVCWIQMDVEEMVDWCFEEFGEPKRKVRSTRWQAHRTGQIVLFRFRDLADATLFQMRWR